MKLCNSSSNISNPLAPLQLMSTASWVSLLYGTCRWTWSLYVEWYCCRLPETVNALFFSIFGLTSLDKLRITSLKNSGIRFLGFSIRWNFLLYHTDWVATKLYRQAARSRDEPSTQCCWPLHNAQPHMARKAHDIRQNQYVTLKRLESTDETGIVFLVFYERHNYSDQWPGCVIARKTYFSGIWIWQHRKFNRPFDPNLL